MGGGLLIRAYINIRYSQKDMICQSTGVFNIRGVRRFSIGGGDYRKPFVSRSSKSGSIQALATASHARATSQQSDGTQSPGIGGEPPPQIRGPFKGAI